MFSAPSCERSLVFALACALGAILESAAPAQTIDVSLNVHYNDPQDVTSGGTWEVIAKSDSFGIHGLSLRLTNILPNVQFAAPRGQVNGSDGAGFWITANVPQAGHRNLSISQAAIPSLGGGEEQSLFYGVGTLEDGAPDWPGAPPGSNSIGPTFTSLANVQNVPWATGDPLGDAAWDTAATFASGAFGTGGTPGFFAGTTGQVFTSLGTSTMAGNVAAATISTLVRTNAMVLADYNENGIVDAADYVLWRSDPNSYGGDPAGYDLWVEHFGEVVPGSAAAPLPAMSAIPEPATALLLTLALAPLAASRRRGTNC